jgi:hypothetical protein
MSEPHGFELAFPQGILILVVDQNKVTFAKNMRMKRLIVLTLDSFLVILVRQGCIMLFLIDLLEI